MFAFHDHYILCEIGEAQPTKRKEKAAFFIESPKEKRTAAVPVTAIFFLDFYGP